MNVVKIILIAQIVITLATVNAEPFSYDSADGNVQEYVVDCFTNSIRNGCNFALMQYREDETLRPEDHTMPWHVAMDLGLDEWRCVEMLKGDRSVGNYSVCYLYETPRMANELPMWFPNSKVGVTNSFSYKINGVWIDGDGKDYWRFSPPYKPLRPEYDEFVLLMLLSPEKCLDKKRIHAENYADETNTLRQVVGTNVGSFSPEEIAGRLGIESTFSNRVFRMNEGCAFQVNYEVPPLDWRRRSQTREAFNAQIQSNRVSCTYLMHLNPDEVSELLRLSYAVDGDPTGYESARNCCTGLLHCVTNIQTTIGKRVFVALTEGGVLTNSCGLVVTP